MPHDQLGHRVVGAGTDEGALIGRGEVHRRDPGGNPLVLDGTATFGDVDGNVYFVDINRGVEVKDPVQLDGAITTSPVASEQFIYFVTEAGTLYARNPSTFNREWEETYGGGIFVKPILWNDSMFLSVISEESPLLSLRADTSTTKWPFTPAEE